jgi:hypothetical protein
MKVEPGPFFIKSCNWLELLVKLSIDLHQVAISLQLLQPGIEHRLFRPH